MVSSRLQNSVGRVGSVVVLSAVLAALCGGAAASTGSVRLELVPVRESAFAVDGGQPNAAAGPGRLLVYGRFDDPRLSIESIDRITVIAPDGRQVPLTVDGGSLFFEFDRIVSVEFFFLVDAEQLLPAAEPLVLKWGEDVRAENAKVERIVLDANVRERIRAFRWGTGSAGLPPESRIASIEVIADSSAEYHFLWYLLPMALIFLLLTIRKIRASHSPDRTVS